MQKMINRKCSCLSNNYTLCLVDNLLPAVFRTIWSALMSILLHPQCLSSWVIAVNKRKRGYPWKYLFVYLPILMWCWGDFSIWFRCLPLWQINRPASYINSFTLNNTIWFGSFVKHALFIPNWKLFYQG